jgi:HD-GYP domain-containing protein (c-di-GMP phosphodiesterase class II)
VSLLTSFSAALEARDPYLQGHSTRVTAFAEALARLLGWRRSELEALRLGGSLHDVGKIAVDAGILRKPGPLTEAELAHIRIHPVAGARLIDGVADLLPALPYVLHHHERWDGRGYPHRLEGDSIPLEARVLGVADAFDAMTSARPYRPALSVVQALDELERCSGSQFDPSLTRVFVESWECGEIAPAERPIGVAI